MSTSAHLKPGEPIPDDIPVGKDNHHIAQEWTKGNRYCSYSVVRQGRVEATGLYPVLDTIDGSSSVYFTQHYHAGIYAYIEKLVSCLPPFNGQLAFDFIDVGKRLVVMECNPRATSGLHLWSDTPDLARAITDSLGDVERPVQPLLTKLGHQPQVQVAPGMMMWSHEKATPNVWVRHMARLMGSKDVIWKGTDAMPSFAQPFLLTTYYRMCKEKGGISLPDMFQNDVLWEPSGDKLEKIRELMVEADKRDEAKLEQQSEKTLENDSGDASAGRNGSVADEILSLKKRNAELEQEVAELKRRSRIEA